MGGTKAIWVEDFDCGTPDPAPPTAAPPTAAPTPAPPPPPTDDGTFSAADLCADEALYTNVASSTVDGVTFCSRLLADGASYEFVMLVKPDLAWGAVGFNSGTKMPGTEVMWLGVENAQATLKYKTAPSYDEPVNVAGEVPQDATVENVPAGTQARWTRPFKQGELAELTVDTSAYNIMFASKAGAQGSGFSYHNKREVLSSINLAIPGASAGTVVQTVKATAGNLAHGGLMIFAWACLSPIGISFMKYGKHLPVSYWFNVHKFLMPLAILFTIAGFAAILASGVKYDELAVNPKSKTHALCGFAVLALCIVQGLLGFFRGAISKHEESDSGTPFNHGPNRYIFNALHRTTGWVLYGLSLATIYKGVTLFEEEITDENPRAWLQDPAGSLFQAYCFVALGLVVILELLHVTKYEWSSGGPFSCSGDKTKTAAFAAEGDMEKKVRTIALALFSAFSIAVTITLWVIIADTST